jgi:MarR family transcriptional regulator, organic hydroperoxide resistance regulator
MAEIAQVGYSVAVSASKHRIYHRLQLAAHRLQKAADRALLSAANVTTSQAAVLAIVGGGPVMQRSVAKQLGLNESALTAMTSRLVLLGFLERKRDATDVRAWQLELTPDGRAVLKQIEKPFKRINQQIESILSAEDLAQLADYLQRIGEAFDEG